MPPKNTNNYWSWIRAQSNTLVSNRDSVNFSFPSTFDSSSDS